MRTTSKKNGSILIEVLVAVAISAAALVAIIQASSRSVANSGFSRRQAEATVLADKGIQIVKNMRTSGGWTALPTSTTNYCYNGSAISTTTYPCAITGTEYTGQVTVTPASSPTRVNIVSRVNWVEGVGSTSKTFSAKKEAVIYRF